MGEWYTDIIGQDTSEWRYMMELPWKVGGKKKTRELMDELVVTVSELDEYIQV